MKKRNILTVGVIVLLALNACSSDSTDSETSGQNIDNKIAEEQAVEKKVEVYQPFNHQKLQGKWKVVDASPYWKANVVDKVITFQDTTVNFPNKGEYYDGTFKIENNQLIFKATLENDGKYSETHNGGFVGDNPNKLKIIDSIGVETIFMDLERLKN